MEDLSRRTFLRGALLAGAANADCHFREACELGPRPIDMHLSAMKKMGAKVNDEYGTIECTAEHGLKRYKNYIEISFCRYN